MVEALILVAIASAIGAGLNSRSEEDGYILKESLIL